MILAALPIANHFVNDRHRTTAVGVTQPRNTETMYQNILVSVDRSDSAQEALREATELAVALKAELTVLSVVAPLPTYASTAGVDISALEADGQADAKAIVKAALDTMPEGLTTHGMVRTGHPGSEIVAQIGAGGHDLVVLGSRGRGRVVSGFLGSVVSDVHFSTSVPMLVIHPRHDG